MIPSPKHKIADLATAYRGVKFTHQGRNPKVGFDCVGYVGAVLDDYGYPCRIPSDYKESSPPALVQEMLARYLKRIPEHYAEIGDVCVVAEGNDRLGRHLAILAGKGQFWVCDRSAGVRRRQLARETVEGYYRVPD